jgi:hypothetical protein
MKSIYKVLTINLVVASMTALVPVQPASAQILELATGALGLVNSVFGKSDSQPVPQPVAPVIIPQQSTAPPLTPDMKVGAGNFNSNTLNLCISGCLPNGSRPQVIPPRVNPVNTFPSVPIAQPAPQVFPPGVNPVNTFPPAPIAQPAPQVFPPGVNPVNTFPPATTQQLGTPVPLQPVPN